MVAMFDEGFSTIILKEYYICIKFNCNILRIFLLILPLCSIYRYGGHDGWSAGSSDITFKEMIQTKYGLNWPRGFRGEEF